MNRTTTIATAFLLSASGLSAADWPMYRGDPSLTGVAQGRLPDKPELLWTFKAHAPVRSTAAIVGDRVFVGCNDSNVYALDFSTGKKIWAATTDGTVESSPLVLNGTVFVGSSDGHLYALNASDGKVLWKFKTDEKILAAPNWYARPASDTTSQDAAPVTNILVGSYDYKLYSLNAVTGKSNWVYETGNYINGSPAVGDGKTVFGGCDGLLHVVALSNGALTGSNDIGAPIAASVGLAGDRAYFGHYQNRFVCADLTTGTNAWSYQSRNFPYFSSPAITPDRVVFGGRDKQLHCVNRADGSPVWTFATRGRVDSSPVVAGEKVVVGSNDGRVYIVSMNDGSELWSYDIGQPVESSPAVSREKIVIGGDDGSVYCFGIKRQ
ncbi:MAG TPA: PQQ-binding-like beta-propeller repeat protein [Verrucomicrobiota bacterium]|nr:PQQ-binding-like beta-propeller repeat protein [Verrucomicrobiota bacterium]